MTDYDEGRGVPVFLELEDRAAPRRRDAASGRVAHRLRELTETMTAEAALEHLGETEWDGGDEGPYLRAINFHNTSRRRLAEVERQLETVAATGLQTYGEAAVRARLDGREAPAGFLCTFYEGLRNQYDHALPLLERLGMTAWFVIPTGFVDTPPLHQRAMADAHEIAVAEDEHGDGRLAMSWDELRDVVARGHVVACHTATHVGVADVRTDADARRELHASRQRLETELRRRVHAFSWLWGTPFGIYPDADRHLLAAGYDTVIAATKLQRIA